MIKLKSIIETFDNWNSKYWIHYSNVDYLKIRGEGLSHFDLAGIYLFPYKFVLKDRHSLGHFKNKKFKLIVEINRGLKILDWGEMTAERLKELLTQMGHEDAFEELLKVNKFNVYRQEIESMENTEHANKLLRKLLVEPHHQDTWSSGWSLKKRPYTFMWNIFHFIYRNPMEWNAAFRKIGYDAIFDDTGAMWEGEVQLIVLDDANVKIIKTEPNDL